MRRLTRWILWATQIALLYTLSDWIAGGSGDYVLAIGPLGGIALGLGAGSLLGGLAGGGGSSGGGGGIQGVSQLNPASLLLNDLFGTQLFFGRRGVRVGKNPGDPRGIFGEADNPTVLINALQQLMGPNPFTELQQRALDIASQESLNRLPQSLDLLDDVQRTALELSRTGIRTDATPIFDTAISRFNRDILPQIAELQGLPGIQSSGFRNLSSQEGRRLLEEAANIQVQLDENANLRRAQAGPAVAGLAAANVALPINLAGDIFNLGEFERQLPLDQANRTFQIFKELTGLGSPGVLGTTQNIGGFPTTSNFANTLGGLGSLIGGIGSFGSLFDTAKKTSTLGGLGSIG